MIGFSACCSGAVTTPSVERTVLLLRSTVAIEPIPVANGAALAVEALVAEQTRPMSSTALTAGGTLGLAHAFAWVSVGVAVLAAECCWAVALGAAWPDASATAVGSEVTLAVDVPNVSEVPATERFRAVAVADPAYTSGESADAGPATTNPARRQAAAPAPIRLIRFTCIPFWIPGDAPKNVHLVRLRSGGCRIS